MSDRLRELWDFDDLDGSEVRLHAQLDAELSDEGRAQVLTQLARVEGLRGKFDAAEDLLREAERLAGDSTLAAARIDLERGRILRSGGDTAAAFPLFESAFTLAIEAGGLFVAGDAAHMAPLAAADRETYLAWASRGIELAQSNDDARYWLGPLLNNLGWEHFEAGEYPEALDAFERALAARENDPGNQGAIALARYAVGKALRALGRSEEAVPLVELAVSWSGSEGKPDGWLHEELAEEYAAVGREKEAGEQARLAVPLLERDDPSFTEDAERAARLRGLAGEPPDD
jgi:tetratricopeptide (TPR) repeat protein